MARPGKMWKRKSNGFYYTKIDGKQRKLSQSFKEAQQLFYKLRGEPTAVVLNTTLKQASDLFLEHSKLTKAERTYENQHRYLQALCDHFGKGRRIRDLTGSRIEAYLIGTG